MGPGSGRRQGTKAAAGVRGTRIVTPRTLKLQLRLRRGPTVRRKEGYKISNYFYTGTGRRHRLLIIVIGVISNFVPQGSCFFVYKLS